jgi:hypothetical protein
MRFFLGSHFTLPATLTWACASLCGAAQAGAWVSQKGSGKLILNQIEQTQDRANVVHFRHKEIYQSLLLEYGVSDSFGIAAKRGVQERFLPQDNARSHESRFGFTLNTPAIATGLLPPYVFRLAKSWLPVKQIKREKRASMTLGWHNGRDEYWTALAQADRISIGRFSVTQEAEFDRVRGKGRDWRNWLYRFSLGFANVDIGSEAHHFIDYAGSYQALSHSYLMQWRPQAGRWQMRLKSGTRRAPLGNFSIQKNDTLTLEFKLAF